MELAGIPLSQYVKQAIYYGIKTGYNQAFIISDEIRTKLILENPASEKAIKPLVIGDDIRKWTVSEKNRYLLYMHHGIDIKDLTAVINYLKPYQQRLEQRATKQAWYELQQPQMRYSTEFTQHKIVYPIIAKEPRFTLDKSGAFMNDATFSIPTNDLFLLGILNSASVWSYLKQICAVLGDSDKGGRLNMKAIYLNKLPIPNTNEINRKSISKLVQKCLDAKGVGCEAWEKEIDVRVVKLYGLEDNYDLN